MRENKLPNISCASPTLLPAEYCSRGSLYDVIQAAKRDQALAAQLTWARRLSLAHDAAVGLNYLHCRSPPILHRDGERQHHGSSVTAVLSPQTATFQHHT